MKGQKFSSRSGTLDYGNSYEFLMSAYYSLRLSLNEAVSDFKLSTNNNDMGNFDDVVLEITYNDGKQHLYALQLKHRGVKEDSITTQAFDSEKGGNYSLKKYCEGFKKIEEVCKNNEAYNIPFENFHFVLYTNQLLPKFHSYDKNHKKVEADELQLKSKVTIYKHDECVARGLLDLSEAESFFIYKFRNNPEGKLDQQFLDQFVLYTKQKDAQEIERRISRFINELFVNCDSNVVVDYINFFKFWWRGDFGTCKLTKRDVMLKLSEYVLTPHIPQVVFEKKTYGEEKSNLLNECFESFDLSVVNDVENVSTQELIWEVILKEHFGDVSLSSWSQPFSDKDFFPNGIPISAQGNNFIEQSLKKIYVILWHLDKLPLFIKVSDKARSAIYAAIKLCENNKKKKKFILLDSNFEDEEFSEDISILQNLADLQISNSHVYNKICKYVMISLQGREYISLDRLTRTDQFNKIVTMREIIQMLDNNFVVGDDCKKSLPKHYITRFSPKIFLSSNVADEVKDIFVVSCQDFTKPTFKRKTYDLNKYLLMKQSASVHPFTEGVIILVSGVCTKEEFRNVCILNKEENCHHFKMVDKNVFEWMESQGSINALRQYHLDSQDFASDNFVKDLDLVKYFTNKINVICAAPGMGKSVMLKFLSYNCPSNYWVISVNLNDHIKFFKEEHEPLEIVRHLLENETKRDFDRDFAHIFAVYRKILFLWDGFDELPNTCIHSVISMMKSLYEEGYHQWIAARINSKEFLENTFSLFSITVTQFSEKDQQQYIYYQLKEKFDDEEKVEEMVLKLNQNMSSSLNCGYFDYSRIPLQIYMVMEIFLKNPEKYLEEFKILTLTDIYHEFIEGRFSNLFERAHANKNNYLMQKIQRKFKEAQLLQYEIAALKASFDNDTFASLNLNCEKFLEAVASSRDSLALIFGLNDENKPIFTHKTYEEFLAASWLVKNYQDFPKLVEVIFQDDYRNIRLMFDMILAKDSLVHIGILYKNITVLEDNREQVSTCKDKGGRNSLQIACSWGMVHPCLNISRNESNNIVISADETLGNPDENVEMIKFLLSQGCDPLEKDDLFKMNSFEYSDHSQSLRPIEVMMSLNYQIDLAEMKHFCDLNTLLYYSVRFNYPNLFYHLSDYPYMEILSENEEPRTLLQFAVGMDRIEFVATLLNLPHYQEVINRPYKDLGGPLFSAAKNGNLEMFKLLREKGAKLNQNQYSPLITAVQLGFTEFCRKLLTEERINPNDCYTAGISLLQAAALRNHLETMKLLLDHGADVNYVNYFDHTALDFGIDNASLEAVQLLVKFGADVNRQGTNLLGYTALHNACERDSEDIIRLLLEAGADPTIKSNMLYTPLHVALVNRHENVAKVLIQANSTVINEYSQEKSTPLTLAALENYYTTIAMLAKLGADMDSIESKDSPLRIATLKKFGQSVDTLIKCGASVNKPDQHGFTPLFYAVINEKILKLFLDNPSTDVNAKSTLSVTALHFAAQNEKVEAVDELIKHGADINAKDWKNETPLHYAITVKNVRVADCILKYNPKLEDAVDFVRLACVKDAPDCLLSLINHGVDVNVRDDEGRSGLHFAAAASPFCVKVLMMKAADVNVCDNQDFSPLCFAVLSSNLEIIKELADNRADVTKGFGSASALHLSARIGDITTLVYLITTGYEINVQDESGMTPLHCAIEKTIGFVLNMLKSMESWKFKFQTVNPDFQNCARELIEKGADITIKNKLGWSPLAAAGLANNLDVIKICCEKYYDRDDLEDEWQKCFCGAASKNFIHILQFLLDNKLAEIDRVEKEHQMTPLHYACAGGAYDAAVFLIDNGANVNSTTLEGCTPLYFCASVGKLDLVKLLVENKADIDTPNEHGNTSLFGAASRGFIDVVTFLHDNGADVDVIDVDGDTPLHDAAAQGHVEVVKYLVSKNAVNCKNKNGKLPVDLARENRNDVIVKILETTSIDQYN